MKKLISVLLIFSLIWAPALYAAQSAWDGGTTQNPWKSVGSDTYYDTGDVAVGEAVFVGDLTVNSNGVFALKETTAPGATAGYGKLYVQSSTNLLYFKDSTGVEYDLTAGGGGGGAPTNATYLLVTSHASLPNARTVLAGSGITITDGGAGSTMTWSIDNDAIKDTMIDWGTGANQISTADVPEQTNLYYTDARARAAISCTATGLTYNSGTGVLSLTAGYTIPTTGSTLNWDAAYTKRVDTWSSPLQFAGNTASILQAGAAQNGYLSSADWNTFNGKEDVLTFNFGLTRVVNTITNDLITGKAGGQAIVGGTGASEDLVLQSTTSGTRGSIICNDELLVKQGYLEVGDEDTAVDGKIGLFSEQGATDYTVTLNPNAAMTSDVDLYLPASFPAGVYFLKVDPSGVMSYDSNTYLTAEADTLSTVCGRGNSTSTDILIGSSNAFYFGASDFDGTWRIVRSGDNLVFERRESGSYVAKFTMTP